jgi:hypothetical protein
MILSYGTSKIVFGCTQAKNTLSRENTKHLFLLWSQLSYSLQAQLQLGSGMGMYSYNLGPHTYYTSAACAFFLGAGLLVLISSPSFLLVSSLFFCNPASLVASN